MTKIILLVFIFAVVTVVASDKQLKFFKNYSNKNFLIWLKLKAKKGGSREITTTSTTTESTVVT